MRTGAAVTLLAALPCAAPAAAGVFACQMTEADCPTCAPLPVTFTLTRAQFVGPQHPNDPPRRTTSRVEMDGTAFTAEAILMKTGAAGFYDDAGPQGTRLLIVQPDGTARYTEQPEGRTLTGTCTETR